MFRRSRSGSWLLVWLWFTLIGLITLMCRCSWLSVCRLVGGCRSRLLVTMGRLGVTRRRVIFTIVSVRRFCVRRVSGRVGMWMLLICCLSWRLGLRSGRSFTWLSTRWILCGVVLLILWRLCLCLLLIVLRCRRRLMVRLVRCLNTWVGSCLFTRFVRMMTMCTLWRRLTRRLIIRVVGLEVACLVWPGPVFYVSHRMLMWCSWVCISNLERLRRLTLIRLCGMTLLRCLSLIAWGRVGVLLARMVRRTILRCVMITLSWLWSLRWNRCRRWCRLGLLLSRGGSRCRRRVVMV